MNELLRWQTEHGPVVVEVDDRDPGYRSVSRRSDDGLTDARGRFEEALDNVRAAAVSALRTFRDKALAPDEVSLEFGVKLNASVGAVIAKTSTEGHLAVRLTWTRSAADGGPTAPDDGDGDRTAPDATGTPADPGQANPDQADPGPTGPGRTPPASTAPNGAR
ncbi:CU044_2847 family protein [Streptomyces sp. B1866]|uniref:CU044_2847 family protein n=1 Tax=Streptomyces sp. B1866 TaxID=3075431 RepID=UPI0028921BD0|nr:CU044_2847 family protein [Streptomyces sp. B1866]MDT3395352.1 CU044_2847 family protein [Streptomyces sp. B1866]